MNARFVLKTNYVECDSLEVIFQQKTATAICTSFSFTYAMMLMIWHETPIIDKFCKQI